MANTDNSNNSVAIVAIIVFAVLAIAAGYFFMMGDKPPNVIERTTVIEKTEKTSPPPEPEPQPEEPEKPEEEDPEFSLEIKDDEGNEATIKDN